MSETIPDEIPHRVVNGRRVAMTEEEIAEQAADAGVVAVPRWRVRKLVMIERLADAGLLRAAHQALRLGATLANLTDEQLLLRERWNGADAVWSDDPHALALLAAIGADPAVILAR